MTDPERAARREEREKARQRERADRRVTSRRRAAAALRFARALIRWLPMPVACALGDVLGTLAFWFGGRARRQTQEHLAFAMPELPAAERRRIARRSFALLGRGACAFVVAHREGHERALKRFNFENIEVPRAALAQGKGVILVSFHYGPFELFGSWIGNNLGARAQGRESDIDGPNALLIKMREELGCETIERGDPRRILRTLKDGRSVSFMIDQDVGDINGVFMPFFGRLAHTPIGPAALSARTGAPIVMGFVVWDGLSRQRAWCLPPMSPRTDIPREEAVMELTFRMTQIGEAEVRKRPEHWVWMHRRWENRPEDLPDLAVYPPANP